MMEEGKGKWRGMEGGGEMERKGGRGRREEVYSKMPGMHKGKERAHVLYAPDNEDMSILTISEQAESEIAGLAILTPPLSQLYIRCQLF